MLMLPYVFRAMQLNALDAVVYLHLDILRISILVSCLGMVTNQISKIYSFYRGEGRGARCHENLMTQPDLTRLA
jgi:hypothetical protein